MNDNRQRIADDIMEDANCQKHTSDSLASMQVPDGAELSCPAALS